jgi:tRNA pseudouridine55 synthase
VSSPPDGVVVVDKPAGMTSHDVVESVRATLGIKKIGHAGTLDPDATGLLVLGVGRATRLLDVAQAHPKRYRAEARFGTTTTTQDASGDVVERRDAGGLDAESIVAALDAFRGEIEQVPPMVSAVKVGGEKLYEKARRGEEVERAPRKIAVFGFDLLEFTPGDEPAARFDVLCSAGTYVRTLVHDLGAAVGCGAHLTNLRRTEAAGFSEADAVPLEKVDASSVRPPLDAIKWLPRLEVDAAGAEMVSHGRALQLNAEGSDKGPKDGMLLSVVHGGDLLAIYRCEGTTLVAHRVFTG